MIRIIMIMIVVMMDNGDGHEDDGYVMKQQNNLPQAYSVKVDEQL